MFDSETFDDSTGTMVGSVLPDYISEFIDDFETKNRLAKEKNKAKQQEQQEQDEK